MLPARKAKKGEIAALSPETPSWRNMVPEKETSALMPVMICANCTPQPTSTTFRKVSFSRKISFHLRGKLLSGFGKT